MLASPPGFSVSYFSRKFPDLAAPIYRAPLCGLGTQYSTGTVLVLYGTLYHTVVSHCYTCTQFWFWARGTLCRGPMHARVLRETHTHTYIYIYSGD